METLLDDFLKEQIRYEEVDFRDAALGAANIENSPVITHMVHGVR